MNIKFQLKRPSVDTETAIIMVITYNRNRLRYFTGHSVHPDQWDKNNQVILNDKINVNDVLSELKNKAKRIFSKFELAHNRKPTTVELKDLIDVAEEKKKPTANNFYDWVQDKLIDNPNYAPKTKQWYENTLNKLRDFEKTTPGVRVAWNRIDLSFYNKFISFLQKKDFAQNTIAKHIQNLKNILRQATEEGLNINEDFKKSGFKKKAEETGAIYLTESEINALYELDLSNNSRLEKVRDLFLVGCWTGLRFSDLIRVKPQNIEGDSILLEMHKTKSFVEVPIIGNTKDILEKYNYQLPQTISNQKFNLYLKEIASLEDENGNARIPALKKDVELKITIGGREQHKKGKKWEFITTHTARRSFATNAYKMGISTITIMAITGHRTEAAFLRYIRSSQKEHVSRFVEQWKEKSQLMKLKVV